MLKLYHTNGLTNLAHIQMDGLLTIFLCGEIMLIYLNLIETEEDKRKFERIYHSYKQTMFYATNRILKNQDSAEDAVHNAFLRVINHLEKINENDCHKTRAFLVVILKNIAIDIYRKESMFF